MNSSSRAGVWLRFTAFLLLGYALAGPVRLSFYFYAKPFWDLLIDGVLVVAAAVLALKWLGEKGRGLAVLIPVLALSWMRVEYMLFSRGEIFSIFSYLFIALWGIGFAAAWRLPRKKEVKSGASVLPAVSLIGGLLLGFVSWFYIFIVAISIIFVLGLSGYSVTLKLSKGIISYPLGGVMAVFVFLISWILPIPRFFKSQEKFHDKVVYSRVTRFQKLDITEWKGNYWFYQDGINQFSSIDSWLYFEPFAHPVMQLTEPGARVLIIGGENGMLARELLKYEDVLVDLVAVDREYLTLSRDLSYLTALRGDVFEEDRFSVIHASVIKTIVDANGGYDAIFVDVPDPIDIELNRYFTKEFYELCHDGLKENGLIVTQSGSPYFATTAFRSIQKTMEAANFQVQAYHNQILTLGEWAWTIGAKTEQKSDLNMALKALTFDSVQTQWINNEAMQMMLSFGKAYVVTGDVKINTIKEPVIYKYYNQGNYQLQ